MPRAAKLSPCQQKQVRILEFPRYAYFAQSFASTIPYLQKHRIAGEAGKLTLVVDEEPCEAGIDPYNKLIDRVPDDNRKEVTSD